MARKSIVSKIVPADKYVEYVKNRLSNTEFNTTFLDSRLAGFRCSYKTHGQSSQISYAGIVFELITLLSLDGRIADVATIYSIINYAGGDAERAEQCLYNMYHNKGLVDRGYVEGKAFFILSSRVMVKYEEGIRRALLETRLEEKRVTRSTKQKKHFEFKGGRLSEVPTNAVSGEVRKGIYWGRLDNLKKNERTFLVIKKRLEMKGFLAKEAA